MVDSQKLYSPITNKANPKKPFLDISFNKGDDSAALSIALSILLTSKFLYITKNEKEYSNIKSFVTKSIVGLETEHQAYLNNVFNSIEKNKKESIYDILDGGFEMTAVLSLKYLTNLIYLKYPQQSKIPQRLTRDSVEVILMEINKEIPIFIKLKCSKNLKFYCDLPKAAKAKLLLNDTDGELNYSLAISAEVLSALEDHIYYPLQSKAFYMNHTNNLIFSISKLDFSMKKNKFLIDKIKNNEVLASYDILRKKILDIEESNKCYICGLGMSCSCHHYGKYNEIINTECKSGCISKMRELPTNCYICKEGRNGMTICFGGCGHTVHLPCLKSKECPCEVDKLLEFEKKPLILN